MLCCPFVKHESAQCICNMVRHGIQETCLQQQRQQQQLHHHSNHLQCNLSFSMPEQASVEAIVKGTVLGYMCVAVMSATSWQMYRCYGTEQDSSMRGHADGNILEEMLQARAVWEWFSSSVPCVHAFKLVQKALGRSYSLEAAAAAAAASPLAAAAAAADESQSRCLPPASPAMNRLSSSRV